MRTVGRYALHDEIASGGMGTVHLGRLLGEGGFSRPVAIKRLHPHLARQEEFVRMFMDEARVAARIRHPNVMPTVDVVREGDELFLVMEYVHGAPLSLLLAKMREGGRRAPVRIASAVANGLLLGLHAAHEATDEKGAPLGIVHRDISPQNLLVGADGATRVLDFGVAKARGRLQESTGEGTLKGKLGYLSPEQIRGVDVERATDIYAAAVVIWELLTGRRLFPGDNEGHVLEQILVGWVDPPSKWDPSIPEELDQTILKALSSNPAQRFKSAREMAMAIERTVPAAPAMEVGEWVERTAPELLEGRAKVLATIEHGASPTKPSVSLAAKEEPSTISVTRRPETTTVRRRRALWVALAAISVLVVAVVLVRTRREEEPIKALAAPSASPVASEPAPPPASAAVEVEVEDLTPKHAPSHKTKLKAKPAPTSTASTTASAKPTATANADCTPPYTWDALGRRIYKRHCLHLAPP